MSFNKLSKNAWLEKVAADLRGKSYDALHWNINDRIRIEPLYTAGELPPQSGPVSGHRSWSTVYKVSNGDVKSVNKEILDGLENGADAIMLKVPDQSLIDQFKDIFSGVRLDYISLYLHFSDAPLSINLLKRISQHLSQCEGSEKMNVFIRGKEMPESRVIPDLMDYDPFKTIHIDWKWKQGDWENLDISLAVILRQVNNYLSSVEESLQNKVVSQMYLTVSSGDHYFIEIARLRALRSVMQNILDARGLSPSEQPHIMAMTDKLVYGEDPYQNMIRAASIGMSMAIGGADAILIHPGDIKSDISLDYSARVSLNVQHLMKMESYMDEVQDPAAGSYYIENLTHGLAESAWNMFRN